MSDTSPTFSRFQVSNEFFKLSEKEGSGKNFNLVFVCYDIIFTTNLNIFESN